VCPRYSPSVTAPTSQLLSTQFSAVGRTNKRVQLFQPSVGPSNEPSRRREVPRRTKCYSHPTAPTAQHKFSAVDKPSIELPSLPQPSVGPSNEPPCRSSVPLDETRGYCIQPGQLSRQFSAAGRTHKSSEFQAFRTQ
jgi:hypothetical protein